MDFEDYALRQGSALLRFAVTLTGDPRLAEEIVQTVLMRAFQRWATIGELERTHAYVRRMIVNEHLSWRRRWARVEPRADVEPARSVLPDQTDRHAERAALIGEILELPRRQRAVLALRYFEDMPDAEIAQVLGCSSATVRSIAARALAKLRIQLAAEPPRTGTEPPAPVTTQTHEETLR